MMLGLFYYIVDVRKWNRWCEPCVWMLADVPIGGRSRTLAVCRLKKPKK